MGRRAYSIAGPSALGTTQTIAGVVGSATCRASVFEWDVSSNASPADQVWIPSLGRFTAPGTSTAYTPQPANPSDIAAQNTGGITHSAEPTYAAAFVQQVPLNQRATWKWQAYPECEILAAASANNGIGLRGMGASAAMTFYGTLWFFE